jgi:3-oxoacyl-[acyl-carrier protein] reductase
MMMKDRIVLVTGASRGIGAAIAKLLAAHGAAVAVNYLKSEAAAQQVVEEITRSGGKALAFQADVREEAQVQRMVAEIATQLGPIDTLVSNAAIDFPIKPFTEIRWPEFEAKLTGELRSTFFCCQAVLPQMIQRRFGCIIAISSTLSRQPGTGFSAHSTAKSGLDALMKSMAGELGQQGIRVNVIAPGLTNTDATAFLPETQKEVMARMTPLRRNGQPEDVAGAVLMIASDHCRFITGGYFPVSGGMMML